MGVLDRVGPFPTGIFYNAIRMYLSIVIFSTLVSLSHGFLQAGGIRSSCLLVNQATPSSHENDLSRRKFLFQTLTANLIVLPQLAENARADDGKKVNTATNKRIGGLAGKIRSISNVMDELQRDLMQERFDLVEKYPLELRSYVPVLTKYTDSAFPSDSPVDKGLRVALRYEVGRFFAGLERLKQATSRKALDEAYTAYSDMSIHFDRYMRVGGIYTYYDDIVSLEPYYKGISDDSLIFANPTKDPPEVRDLVIFIKGADKGRTGIVIGILPNDKNNYVVKLDRYKGMREIRVVQNKWVAKRLGEQDPDEVFTIPRK